MQEQWDLTVKLAQVVSCFFYTNSDNLFGSASSACLLASRKECTADMWRRSPALAHCIHSQPKPKHPYRQILMVSSRLHDSIIFLGRSTFLRSRIASVWFTEGLTGPRCSRCGALQTKDGMPFGQISAGQWWGFGSTSCSPIHKWQTCREREDAHSYSARDVSPCGHLPVLRGRGGVHAEEELGGGEVRVQLGAEVLGLKLGGVEAGDGVALGRAAEVPEPDVTVRRACEMMPLP
jgi:hypothetical protein